MRKKRENGMAKESGMGDFPRKQFESVLLHSLRIMDQNREYLQMHLARTGDERTRQALEDIWMGRWVFLLGDWLLAIAALLTLWSGIQYLLAAWPILREGEKKTVDRPEQHATISSLSTRE